ncbi:MAG: hypothetical protein WC910_11110 [Bacteroidales bacterium]|jgi:hypothetical protein
MNLNVLKSYLIKLGVQVDDTAVNKMKHVVNDLTGLVSSRSLVMSKAALSGAGVIVGALAYVDAAIIKNIMNVAEADMSYQLLAQKMFMTADAAKAFKLSSEALDASLFEIAWNAELKGHYFELVHQINSLKTPPEAREMFREVRETAFQFTRLKVSATSALEWISYHLLRMNKGELGEFKKTIKEFSDGVINNIPEWTYRLSQFLQVPIQLSSAGLKVLKDVWGMISLIGGGFKRGMNEFFGKMPSWVRDITALSAILLPMLVIGSPFLKGMAVLVGLLAMIEDFYGYMEGRDSLDILKPFWRVVEYLGTIFTAAIIGAKTLWEHFVWALFNPGTPHPSGMGPLEHAKREVTNFRDWLANETDPSIPNPFRKAKEDPVLPFEGKGPTFVPGTAKKGASPTEELTFEGKGPTFVPGTAKKGASPTEELTFADKINRPLSWMIEAYVELFQRIKETSQASLPPSASLIPATSSASGQNITHNTFLAEIHANTTDPDAIAQKTMRAMERMLKEKEERDKIKERF